MLHTPTPEQRRQHDVLMAARQRMTAAGRRYATDARDKASLIAERDELLETVRKQDVQIRDLTKQLRLAKEECEVVARREAIDLVKEGRKPVSSETAHAEIARLRAVIASLTRPESISGKLSQVKRIIREVADKHGVTVEQINGVRRTANMVAARHEVFYRLHTETSLSLPQIGRATGNFDHTTVMYGARKHAQKIGDTRYAPPKSGRTQ